VSPSVGGGDGGGGHWRGSRCGRLDMREWLDWGSLCVAYRFCSKKLSYSRPCIFREKNLEPKYNLSKTVYTFADTYIIGLFSLRRHFICLKTFADSLIVPRETPIVNL